MKENTNKLIVLPKKKNQFCPKKKKKSTKRGQPEIKIAMHKDIDSSYTNVKSKK